MNILGAGYIRIFKWVVLITLTRNSIVFIFNISYNNRDGTLNILGTKYER
jgi:hypothetical protein